MTQPIQVVQEQSGLGNQQLENTKPFVDKQDIKVKRITHRNTNTHTHTHTHTLFKPLSMTSAFTVSHAYPGQAPHSKKLIRLQRECTEISLPARQNVYSRFQECERSWAGLVSGACWDMAWTNYERLGAVFGGPDEGSAQARTCPVRKHLEAGDEEIRRNGNSTSLHSP